MEFSEHFHLFMFEAPKSQMKFHYLMDRFKYYLVQSVNPKKNFKLKPRSACFGDGVAQSQTKTVDVTSECSSFPHQIALPSQSDVGEHAHTFVQPSHPPDIAPSDFCVDLVVIPIPRYMYFVS